jgi:hypothetical protein
MHRLTAAKSGEAEDAEDGKAKEAHPAEGELEGTTSECQLSKVIS